MLTRPLHQGPLFFAMREPKEQLFESLLARNKARLQALTAVARNCSTPYMDISKRRDV
jgi:hypothetical protein